MGVISFDDNLIIFETRALVNNAREDFYTEFTLVAFLGVSVYNKAMESKEKTRSFDLFRASGIIRGILTVLALAAFGLWLYSSEELTVQGIITAAFSLGLFTVSLFLAVPKAVRFLSGAESEPMRFSGVRTGSRSHFAEITGVIAGVIALRLIIVVIAYVYARLFREAHGSIFATFESIWLKLDTDAPHYISIAENGYTTDAPGMYTLVFLPLFPLLIRALNFVTGSSFVSAMAINLVCTCGACAALYKTAYVDMGRRPAKLAVLFAMLAPAAIFFIAPMSEALFFMLSIITLLALRKNKFWLAAVFGALASFTRSVGILLIIPFIAEAVAYAAGRRRERGSERFAGTVVKLVVCAVVFCLGSFGYLLINKLLWGDWFKFMEFQRENWYQSFGPFFGTVAMQTDQLVLSIGSANETALGLWLPNLLFIFGALALLVFSARTLRTPYTLYFAAYLAVTCGATWLLSAPRYLTALASIPLALAHLCEGDVNGVATGRAKAKAAIVTTVLAVGQALYLLMYVLEFEIY